MSLTAHLAVGLLLLGPVLVAAAAAEGEMVEVKPREIDDLLDDVRGARGLTREPVVRLAIDGRAESGWYPLSRISVQ